MKNKISICSAFIISLVFVFFFVYVFQDTFCDEIWTYGFSYNISKGMIIYRDFNVLQTPLYFFIGSLFIKIFGSYMISLGIFNSLLYAIMITLLFKEKGLKKSIFIVLIIKCFPSSYNLFLTFLCFIILYLIDKNKDNDIIIAFLVSLIFLTKQNIGIVMLVPCLIYSKNKIKSICTFLLPCMILVLYLWCNGALFNFIDYCFLGLFSFASKNTTYTLWVLILWIIICLFLVFNIIKSKFNNKTLFYILCFFSMSYPIFDVHHFWSPVFIFLAFFNENYNINYYVKIMYNSFKYCFSSCLILTIIFTNDFKIVNFNKDLVYLKNISVTNIQYINLYLNNFNIDYDNDKVYLADYYGYLYKLYYNIPIDKYDFFMSGNMGIYNKDKLYNGLEEECSQKKCYFLIDTNICFKDDNQWREYSLYVEDKYKFIGAFDGINVYSS